MREALAILEAEGLVQRRPHRGIVVVNRSYEDLADLREMRMNLEAMAIRRAAPTITGAAFVELEAAMAAEEAAMAAEDQSDFRRAAKDFHHAFVRAARSRALTEMIDGLAQRSRYNFPFGAERMAQSHGEHREIVKALRAKDGNRAAEVLIAHMMVRVTTLRETFPASSSPASEAPAGV